MSRIIDKRIELARWLLVSGELERAKEEADQAADMLLRLFWARLPGGAPPELWQKIREKLEEEDVAHDTLSTERLREVAVEIDLVLLVEEATGKGLPGLDWLLDPNYGGKPEEIVVAPTTIGNYLTALEYATSEARAVLGKNFSTLVVVGGEVTESGSEDLEDDEMELLVQKNRGQYLPPLPVLTAEERAERRLRAEGRSGLYEVLGRLVGTRLDDRFVLGPLIAAGGQNVVFAGSDGGPGGRKVAIKLPRLDYDRPVTFGSAEVKTARANLVRSYELLNIVPGSWFAEPLGLIKAPNPLHAEQRPSWVRNEELFLVEEFVEGRTLVETVSNRHWGRALEERPTERLAIGAIRQLLEVFVALLEVGRPLRYTDLSPRNIIVSDRHVIRLVDASSVWPVDEEGAPLWTTPAYLPRSLAADVDQGKPLRLSDATLLYGLGKLLHFSLTNREPLVGQEPDLDEPHIVACSAPVQKLTRRLLEAEHGDFRAALEETREVERALDDEEGGR